HLPLLFLLLSFLLTPPPPTSTLFPYTTLFRSIAMIQGYCIGGGLGVALCCDLRLASDNSRFAVPAAKLGLGYGFTGIKRLADVRSEEHTSELQSRGHLVCRLLLEKKKKRRLQI